MIRIVMAVLALALVTVPTNARVNPPQLTGANCDLTEATSPTIRGVKLGMTMPQSVGLFPGARERAEITDAVKRIKAGTGHEVVYLSFYPATDAPSKSDFAGVDSIGVGIFDGRVIDLLVTYVGVTWNSIDEWVGKLSETLRLPPAGAWMAGPSEAPNKVLKCKGVDIEAAIQGGGASIRIRNSEAFKTLETHQNPDDKRERRGFKP